MDVARVQNQALRAELQTLRGEQQRQTQTLDTEQETSASASEALRAEQQALRAEQTQTLDTEQETSPSEALVLVAREGEGAVPVLDSELLTLRQQALDAAAAAPEVRELLLKILNLPTAQQMVISGALNLHQPSQPSGPSGPTVTPTDGDTEQIAVTGGCETTVVQPLSGQPPRKSQEQTHGTMSWDAKYAESWRWLQLAQVMDLWHGRCRRAGQPHLMVTEGGGVASVPCIRFDEVSGSGCAAWLLAAGWQHVPSKWADKTTVTVTVANLQLLLSLEHNMEMFEMTAQNARVLLGLSDLQPAD